MSRENWSPDLRFNSRSRLDSKNLATHFDPSTQPPVVVQKLGRADTVGLSRTPRSAFKAVDPERLAYAVELARRNVNRARRSYSEVTPASSTVEDHPIQNTKAVSVQEKATVHLLQTQGDGVKKVQRKSQGAGKVEKRDIATDQLGILNAELQKRLLMISKGNDREMASGRRRTGRPRWEGEDEEENKKKLEQWRKEQQARNARMMYDLSQQIKDLEKRIGRIQECDSGISQQGEVVKKLAAAQRAALRTLQTFGGGGRGGAGGGRCGAEGFIPPELSLLIQQLALLSAQLGGREGGNMSSDITASVLQLVKTMEERQRIARLSRQEMEMRAQDTSGGGLSSSTPVPKTKKKKKKNNGIHSVLQPPRVALLLDPQLQKKRAKSRVQPKKTHYTQGTYNSLRRQQPPVEWAVSFSSPAHAQTSALNSSVVRPCQLARSHSPGQDTRSKEAKGSSTSASSRVQRNLESEQEVVPAKEGDALDESSVPRANLPHSEGVLNDGSGAPAADLTSVIRQQSEQMTLLRSDIAQKLTDLKADFDRQINDPQVKKDDDIKPVKKHVTLAPNDPVPVSNSPIFNGISNDPVSKAAGSNGHVSNGVVPNYSVSSTPASNGLAETGAPTNATTNAGLSASLPSSSVAVSMPVPGGRDCSLVLRRLDELEAEEDEISRRWTSVVYEDLATTTPRYRQCTGKTTLPEATPTPVDASSSSSSTRDREELYDYKERYTRYLDATGVSTRGGFNPWDMAESIADALLDDLMEGVAVEVGQVCDGCVENVYSSEFKRPP